MTSVTLISSPLSMEARYGKFSLAGNTQPTFALVCLGAVAEQEGVKVHIIDAAAESLTPEQVFKEVREIKPELVGISSTTVGIVPSGKLARMIKAALPGTLTVIGGCHATAIPDRTLAEFPGFDLAVIGEGEATFKELIGSLKSGREAVPRDLPGTAVRQNGAVHVNPGRPFIQDLSSLPLPAWHLLRGFPRAFHPTPTRIRRFPCASIVLTRGCPNQCLFCDRSVFGSKIRSGSVEHAVNIIRDLRHRHGVKEILIEDDTFVTSRRRVEEFCSRLISEQIDISWSCLGRADRVAPEILRLMKRAGCWHISFGIESGDQTILDAMGKNEKISDIENAVFLCRKAGIKTSGFFILGFPGETRKSLKLTRELSLKLPLDDVSIMTMTPFPGTAVYREASRFGSLETDWEMMNALNPVFIPRGLSRHDLDDARDDILKSFYLRPGIVLRKFIRAAFNFHLFIPTLKGLIAFCKVLKKR
jgi:anaerobic magnesium-protoporphyrin IX monomethyl ester cyclase